MGVILFLLGMITGMSLLFFVSYLIIRKGING